jgi:hypothetical protein
MARHDLPDDFVAELRKRRADVVPFIGAGLAIPAGIRDLADAVRKVAAARGLGSVAGDLVALVRQLSADVGLAEAKSLVSAAVKSTDVRPTQTL